MLHGENSKCSMKKGEDAMSTFQIENGGTRDSAPFFVTS